VTIGRVDHDGIPGHQIVLSPGERKKKKVSQSPQKTSSSVPAKPKPSSSMFDAIFPEVPKQMKNIKYKKTHIYLNNYSTSTFILTGHDMLLRKRTTTSTSSSVK
jgi:hypothetical protein